MQTNSRVPTHLAFAVTKNGAKSHWREIGAAWQHNDGKGFHLRLEYWPMNGAEIVIREPRAGQEEGGAL